MTALVDAPVLGCEVPRLFTPPRVALTPATSLGFEAVAFARDVLGIPLMPWQSWLLEHMLELRPDGTFRFRTVLIQVARQNGKSTLAQVLSLWRMFVDRSPLVIGTAQNLDVAEEVWAGAVDMAEGVPDLLSEIAAVDRTNGKKQLRLSAGQRYKVQAATRRGGRGLSGDLVLLDEIREHQNFDAWAAVTKTTMARPKPQIVALSNAGDDTSVVLNHLREIGERSLAGDGDGSFGFFEWSAPTGCALDDPQAWAQANPALGYTIQPESIRSALETDPEPIFRTEVLCQRVAELRPRVIPDAMFARLVRDSAISGAVTVVPEVSMDRSRATIWICGAGPDGVPQVEPADRRPGTEWVADRVAQILGRNDVLAVGVRSGGPAASLLTDVERVCTDAGVPLEKVHSGPMAAFCGQFFDACMSDVPGLHHRGDGPLFEQVKASKRKRSVDAWSWERSDVDTDMADLVAATAAFGLFTELASKALYDPLDNIW